MNIKSFLHNEAGHVTVDWVVLAAGLVAVGFATVIFVSSGYENKSQDISHSLANMDPVAHHEVFGEDPDA